MDVTMHQELQSSLKDYLHYDPANGSFTRKKDWLIGNTTAVRKRVGSLAGYRFKCRGREYVRIMFLGRTWLAHRLAWLYVYGSLPKYIDHINGDGTDNRISNLRQCTSSQNNANAKKRKDNKSGIKGVSWRSDRRKFIATIRHDGRTIFLGCFPDREDAAEAYSVAARKYFGDFARVE